jgi:hypothetical protein
MGLEIFRTGSGPLRQQFNVCQSSCRKVLRMRSYLSLCADTRSHNEVKVKKPQYSFQRQQRGRGIYSDRR